MSFIQEFFMWVGAFWVSCVVVVLIMVALGNIVFEHEIRKKPHE
jgi:hypothetical protein